MEPEWIDEPQAMTYWLDDKYISFTPTELGWRNKWIAIEHVQRTSEHPKWENVFGAGIDIEILEGQRTWRKVLSINDSDIVNLIPKNVDYVSVKYELNTQKYMTFWVQSRIKKICVIFFQDPV